LSLNEQAKSKLRFQHSTADGQHGYFTEKPLIYAVSKDNDIKKKRKNIVLSKKLFELNESRSKMVV
jgi:hypothetical protein